MRDEHEQSTHHPSRRTGALSSDVVANSAVLARAAQFTLSSVAAGGTTLFAALWREKKQKPKRSVRRIYRKQ